MQDKNNVRDCGGSLRKMEDRLFGEAWQINWGIWGGGRLRNDGHMFGEMKSVSKVREQASEWEKNSLP